MNSKFFLKLLLAIGDIFLMYFSILVTLAIRHGDFFILTIPRIKVHFTNFTVVFAVWLMILILLDFYEMPPLKDIFSFISNLAIFIALAFIAGSTYFYFQPTFTPKTVLFIDVIILGVLLFVWRFLFNLFFRILNLKEKIIIIGSRPELKDISSGVLKKNRYEVVARLPAEALAWPSFKEKVYEINPDLVILAFTKYEKKEYIKNNFVNLPLGYNYVSFKNFYEELLQKVPLDSINEAWFLENFRKKGKIYKIYKEAFDIFFSLIGLSITMILFPLISLAIKISSSGPILYKQDRVGQAGRIFTLYKFRTMQQNAEMHGAQWAVEDDPRATFVGRLLRAAHIDELPQFLNILLGDISFVGPRPERPEFVDQLKKEILFYDIRHLIKPGLTGWAQIKYRYSASEAEAREKLKYDLYYIKHRQFVLDLGIILKTVSATLKNILNKVMRKCRNKIFYKLFIRKKADSL